MQLQQIFHSHPSISLSLCVFYIPDFFTKFLCRKDARGLGEMLKNNWDKLTNHVFDLAIYTLVGEMAILSW